MINSITSPTTLAKSFTRLSMAMSMLYLILPDFVHIQRHLD